MENQEQTNARNAINILVQASEVYVAGLDQLGKNFIAPQVQAALQIVAGLVNEKFPGDAATPAVASETAPAKEA